MSVSKMFERLRSRGLAELFSGNWELTRRGFNFNIKTIKHGQP